MKILNFFPTESKSQKEPQLSLMADSSLLKDGKPFYIPDFDTQFTARPAMMVQICRLGKNIAPKFAHRYYNAVGVAVCVTAQTLFESLKSRNEPTDLATSFDGAAILSNLKTIEEPHVIDAETRFNIKVNDTIVWNFQVSESNVAIDNLISNVSRYFTLKIGDYILIGIPNMESITLYRDMHITATINGESILSMHVK